MKTIIGIILLFASCLQANVVYTGEPLYDWALWGNPEYITYHPDKHEWTNRNIRNENWVVITRAHHPEFEKKLKEWERVPEEKETKISFDIALIWTRGNPQFELLAALAVVPNRRLVLVNPEPTFNPEVCSETQYQVWPHLGLLYVGTAAHNEGWDVILHDELVQGYVDLERLVQPGDIVGFSAVATGMERSVELAQHAKHLGASYCIAGNDAAIFRAQQILRLPNRPIDAVFTGNSLTSVRQFLRHIGTVPIEQFAIPGVAVVPPEMNRSNERNILVAEREMRKQLSQMGEFDPQDVFIVPKLNLFENEYWETVWGNYREVFGHKHHDATTVRNALALFAQGCTRTQMTDVCKYCTIASVADLRMPTDEYLAATLEAYRSFGINYVFNTTDSSFEMRRVAQDLKRLGAHFPEGMILYGRAWGLAHHPELIEEWLSLTGGRLLINSGLDSGDARILDLGIGKASQKTGSRLEENRQAVLNIAGSDAHLHYSLIFGSPGETRETCEESMEFMQWSRSVLGSQLDQCEADIFWLNHGSPASRVFHDYGYAVELAALAGKEISVATWKQHFYRHRDTLAVPWECEVAWYDCFTSISVEEAQEYNAKLTATMTAHEGAAPSRPAFNRWV